MYILKCSDGSLYTGCTSDIDRRLREHNAGKASRYTRARLPVALCHSERLPDRGSALGREAEIKKLSRERKLRLCDRARV